MTDQEALAFMQGFSEKLANLGTTLTALEAGLEKQAGWKAALGGLGAAVNALGPAGKAALGAYLFAPIALGGLGGYTLGKAEGGEPPDIEAIMEEERVNNIRRALQSLKLQQGVPVT
jgi:hypothetical protein